MEIFIGLTHLQISCCKIWFIFHSQIPQAGKHKCQFLFMNYENIDVVFKYQTSKQYLYITAIIFFLFAEFSNTIEKGMKMLY